MKDLKLAEAGAYLSKHQHEAKLLAVAAMIVAMSAWTSCSARDVTREARAEVKEAVTLRQTATRFSQHFLPATTGETDEWARTTEEAAAFGVPEALKMATAQSVSRIADVAGMSASRVTFTSAEAVGVADSRNMGELVFQPATYGLKLEANGDAIAAARVVLRLPPATEITSLTLAGDSDQLKATFQLAVYQPAGGAKN